MSAAGPLTVHRPERVAVVIPAKNEAERIEATISAARAITGVDLVVVVDDGSSDATSAVAIGADALVARHKTNRGKAAAMATGAQLIALRENAERADGGESFSEELHAEPRAPGHTGPLPVIDGDTPAARALLFLDADMEGSAGAAQPLVDAVLTQGVDMAIALLPPQVGAGGMGIVVRTARRGIERATGWTATQPLSGTRCITRETWDVCQPLAPGWGVETSLTIDALTGGFWVKEIEADLHHRATGRDLRGRLHRAAQLRDVVRALTRKRHVLPEEPADAEELEPLEQTATVASASEPDNEHADSAAAPLAAGSAEHEETEPVYDEGPVVAEAAETEAQQSEQPTTGAEPVEEHASVDSAADDEHPPPGAAAVDETDVWSVVPEVAEAETSDDGALDDDRAEEAAAAADAASRAERRRERLAVLPVEGTFSDDETRALGDLDIEALARRLRALPVHGAFAPDDVVYLAGIDLDALAARLESAPVEERFDPEHAVIVASHLAVPEPELPGSIRPPLSADEYTSLVVHAAVDAGNAEPDRGA